MAGLKDLVVDTKNARRRGKRAEAMLVQSIEETGLGRSIVIDENNRILAGNGTAQAAAELGLDKVQIVEADGSTLIAVRRTGLTEEQKTRLALFDNRTADLGDWDADVLASLASEGTEVRDLFTDDELARILLHSDEQVVWTPNVTPEIGVGQVTEADLARTRKDMEASLAAGRALKPIVCPHCGGEFALDA